MLTLSILGRFIPRQEGLYLETDLEQPKIDSSTLVIWTMTIGVITTLFFVLKKVENSGEAFKVFLGTVAFAIPSFFYFKSVFLLAFLLLNRIDLGERLEKKYTITFSKVYTEYTPLIYDFRTKVILYDIKVGNPEKLKNLKEGDTLTITFNKGLLGYIFDPRIK